MGVLINGVWTDGELPQEYGEAADLAIGLLSKATRLLGRLGALAGGIGRVVERAAAFVRRRLRRRACGLRRTLWLRVASWP
jgi:hypothetical protein